MSAARNLVEKLAWLDLTWSVGSTGKTKDEIQAKQDVDVAAAVAVYLADLPPEQRQAVLDMSTAPPQPAMPMRIEDEFDEDDVTCEDT